MTRHMTSHDRSNKLEVQSSGAGSGVLGPALAVSLALNLAAAANYLTRDKEVMISDTRSPSSLACVLDARKK